MRDNNVRKQAILEKLDILAFYKSELDSIRCDWSGKQAKALCPFHDDRNPSLSIKLENGLWHCFGCEAHGNIFNFYMKNHGVDYATALQKLSEIAGIGTGQEKEKKIVKTYDYVDEQGNVLYQTVRYEPKTFRQRRPDGNGGWIWDLDGVRLVPYNLPDLVKTRKPLRLIYEGKTTSTGSPTVYITEGEKDTDNLKRLGLVATCSPMGAGKWRTEYNQYFRSKRVIILADNDEPGKDHALRVAKNLHGIAESVKIVELPGLPEKGDVSDWILSGGTKERLLEIVRETPEWIPEEPKSLSERIEEATVDNCESLINEIAQLKDKIKKETLSKKLSKKLNVRPGIIQKAIEEAAKTKIKKVEDRNVTIAHPSYDVHEDILNIGFRETVVVNNEPEDRNFYVISTPEGYQICESNIFQYGDEKIIFNAKDRQLIKHVERWKKDDIQKFINNPQPPLNVFSGIKNLLHHYLEFTKEAHYGLLSAWIIATYFYMIVYAFPFLFIFGMKQSGKSRLLTFLQRLCFNAMKIKGVSVASMVDSIDGVRGVFLNDQAEDLSDKRNLQLLGILCDSYTKGGGNRRVVTITNKGRFLTEFESYGPKAFASIKDIDPDLKDRCIQLTMIRATKDFPEPEANLEIWENTRDKLYRLLLTKWQQVREIYQTTGEGVIQRVRELWRPIETILKLENVADKEMREIKDVFTESMIETQTGLDELEEKLFHVLLEYFLKNESERALSVSDISEKMKSTLGITDVKGLSEWGFTTWRGFNTRIGITISKLTIASKDLGRKNGKSTYLFNHSHIEEIYSRFNKTSSVSSKVVEEFTGKALDSTTLNNDGSNEVVEITDTTRNLPEKKKVVLCNSLINKGKDYLSTRTTTSDKKAIKLRAFDEK